MHDQPIFAGASAITKAVTSRHQLLPTAALSLDGIDAPSAVRASSAGFSVLVLGGLVQPLIAMRAPGLAAGSLALVALAAFAAAGWRLGAARSCARQGVVSAVFSYLLVLPLVVLAPTAPNPVQIAGTLATAVVVGALAGFLSGRRRARRRAAGAAV